MTERPFVHKKAFTNVKLNFIFHDELAKILIKILDRKGIINLGGPTRTVYNFAKKYNPKIKKISSTNIPEYKSRYNLSMNLSKLNNLIK